MKNLARLVKGCDLSDAASLRILFTGDVRRNTGNCYYLDGIRILCQPTHQTTLEKINFLMYVPAKTFHLSGLNEMHANEKTAVADFFLRSFAKEIEIINEEHKSRTKPVKYMGYFYVHNPGQEMILRNSCTITEKGDILIMFQVHFPVYMQEKRNVINGKKSGNMIKELQSAITSFINNFNGILYEEWLRTAKIQYKIRKYIRGNSYCAFIANGSILPRGKGTQLPYLKSVPFISPAEDEIRIRIDKNNVISGLGIKKGVTVITGGGYSGKTTLLDAVIAGVYDHIPGDGREFCITDDSAVKICAEDGRCVQNTNISPFIRYLPDEDTTSFTSHHSSGSTSQAANIMDAVACGAKLLLIDEDRTATNFMIRDARMKRIIKDDPIVPFTDRVRQMHLEEGISTVLVIGGCSEYLDVADKVYIMNKFVMENYTKKVKESQLHPLSYYTVNDNKPLSWTNNRNMLKKGFTAYPEGAPAEYLDHIGKDLLLIGDEKINISSLASVVSVPQAVTIALMIRIMEIREDSESFDLYERVDFLYGRIKNEGLDSVFSNLFKVERHMELPRRHDFIAAILRMRNTNFIKNTSKVIPLRNNRQDAGQQ